MTSNFRELPDPVDYLNDAKVVLSPHKSKLRLFLQDVDRLTQYLRTNDKRCSHVLIHTIADYLRFSPQLLYGFNSITQPRYRLECLTSVPQVNHYVLVEGNNSWIYSFVNPGPQLPSSNIHVRNLIESRDAWNRMLEVKPDNEWLGCLAQIIQEILDDPTTGVSFLPVARKRLIRLSKLGVIPPSIFVHFPLSAKPSDYGRKAEYIASGGSCDVYRFDDREISICFRLLRQPEVSHIEECKLRADFCKEVIVWHQLRHPNILGFMGVTTDIYPRRSCFVLPWLFHGSIVSYLRKHPEHDRFASVGQIVDAIFYLHNLNPPVSHKDIKGANVLVRDDLVCVLTDFGLSNILDSQHSRDSDGKGTYYWMAPEMFGPDRLGADARPRDIYSLGCTIYEIYTGKRPSAIMHATVNGREPTLPPKHRPWSEDEVELWGYIGMCLKIDPDARPNIQLLRNALRDVRDWATSSFAVESQPGVATADFDKVQEWIRHEMPATLGVRGLYTPNTPNYHPLPDLDPNPLEAKFPMSPSLNYVMGHVSATTPQSSTTRAPSMPTPPLTPQFVTKSNSKLTRSSSLRPPFSSRVRLDSGGWNIGSMSQEQPA